MFRALDNNGDWQFGKGKQSYVTGEDEIALDVKTRILCFFRDCFFDADSGIDWWNLLGTNKKDEIIEAVRSVIVATNGIRKINNISAQIIDRNLQLNYSVATIYSAEFIDSLNFGESFNV